MLLQFKRNSLPIRKHAGLVQESGVGGSEGLGIASRLLRLPVVPKKA